MTRVFSTEPIPVIERKKSKPRRRLLSRFKRNFILNKNQRQSIHNSTKKQKHLAKNINIIVNLSERKLTLTESSVLNKGLNFCVTNNNINKIKKNIDSDLKTFTRTLQLRFIFSGSDDKISKFTGNPEWQPPESKCSSAINGFTTFLQSEIKKIVIRNKIKHNISNIERTALNGLKQDKNILIQKADKGGSIVIMNTTDYVNKMLDMLNDPVTYTKTNNIDLEKAKDEADKILNHLHTEEFISKAQVKFLTRCNPKMPVLYGLPKIHKSGCPLRPIVSQISSPAYNLNKLLDYLLTTAEKSITNLLQDTTKFLQIIETLDPLPANCILFTIDVTSLYTVLPHDLIIKYVTEMYNDSINDWLKYSPDVAPIPEDVLQQMIKIILNQTFFTFNKQEYLQNYGITMGAPSSVKLANITLHKHLENILRNYPKTLPKLQLRLIDDIFGIWQGNEFELLEWVKFLNDSHNTIKFTVEYSKTQIPFLDTLVYFDDNNKLKTKLYKKPTDNKQYLHYNSEHPKHVKNSIPYAQALRYRRIISDNDILLSELSNLKENFLNRLYPERIIDKALDKVAQLERLEIIKYREKQTGNWNAIPLILTFNNSLVSNKENNIYNLLQNTWKKVLRTNHALSKLNTLKVVFRKDKTINNMLVATQFPPPRWNTARPLAVKSSCPNEAILTYQSLPCYARNCKTCGVIDIENRFHSTTFNVDFELKHNCDCNSSNIVYLITCLKCELQYVGETKNKLRDRMNGHRSAVHLNKDTPIGIHFNSPNHNLTHLRIIPIELLPSLSITQRRSREQYWQLKIGTLFPQGLNAFPVDKRVLFKDFNIEAHWELQLFWNFTHV
jgi:hypothetical protein